MGQHLGKNSAENGQLDKNVPACFQLVEWKAVQLLWTTFLNGDHHDFIMDKNELQNLFEKWQTEGMNKNGEETEIAWFNNGPNGKERIVAKDLQDILQHYVEKIAYIREEENEEEMNGSIEDEEKNESSKTDAEGSEEMEETEGPDCVDVMDIIFTVLILSSGTTKDKLKLMFKCANFDEGESDVLSKDDILLPLKGESLVRVYFVCFLETLDSSRYDCGRTFCTDLLHGPLNDSFNI